MRILVLAINYWPEQTGIGPFTTGRCEYLAASGHEVVVCTGLPYYPDWNIARGYKRRFLLREEHNGVTILRCCIYVPKQVTSLRRVLHEGSFISTSLARALVQRRRPDAMLVVSPPLGLGLSAVILSRLWGVPYVLHLPDLQPDAAVDLRMLKRGLLVRSLYTFERFAYRNAALISTLTEPMRQRVIAKGIRPEKVTLFSDWAAPELFKIALDDQGTDFRRAHALDKNFLVLHSGNMGYKQALDVVLDAAELSCNDTEIKYLLVGNGAAAKLLQQRASTLALSNVRFLPLQAYSDFMDLLAASNITLITQQRAVADIVFPSKTLTLMAAGRPVIASVNAGSEVARVVRDARAGLVVKPENRWELFNAIEILRKNPTERRAMGRRGREYVRTRWDRDRILTQTTTQLEALISSSGNSPPGLVRSSLN